MLHSRPVLTRHIRTCMIVLEKHLNNNRHLSDRKKGVFITELMTLAHYADM